VFNPLMGSTSLLREACDKEAGDALKACLIRFMKGVRPEAVAFTQALDEPGFLREFIPGSKLDLGRVHFPWRANFNDTVYFLNGEPPLLDAYGAETLAKLKLSGDGILFPDGYALPERAKTFTGIRYVSDVSVRKCRACAEISVAKVAWDFADNDKYLGAKILSIEPSDAPAGPQPVSSRPAH